MEGYLNPRLSMIERGAQLKRIVLVMLVPIVLMADGCKTPGARSGLSSYSAHSGPCGGRPLPSGRTRKARNIYLSCSSEVSHYMRASQIWDMNRWERAEAAGKRDEMRKIGQELPPIKWEGTIPYVTSENWTWTESVYGPDPSCGYDENCTTDSDGKKHCTQTMRSCWHDEDRHESRHCSDETMEYQASFSKPGSDWNESNPFYFDILPNRYDLLPGEVEDIQVYSTNDTGGLSPEVIVGNAWNEYQTSIEFTSGRPGCIYQNPTAIAVNINTVKRLGLDNAKALRRSPNAFRPPTDESGERLDVLNWFEASDRDGKIVNTRPEKINLVDASSTMIYTLSEQSRKWTAELEKAKQEKAKGGNYSVGEQLKEYRRSGFWQKTEVRVLLKRAVPLDFDRTVAQNFYTNGAEVAVGDRYVIDMVGGKYSLYRPSSPLFKGFFGKFELNMIPDKDYYFEVAMYQKGVPFYAQDCEDPAHKKFISCRLGIRSEDSYYSDPLPIAFRSGKGVDNRSSFQSFVDFQGKPLTEKVSDAFKWMFGY
jgi:hypothetical protein